MKFSQGGCPHLYIPDTASEEMGFKISRPEASLRKKNAQCFPNLPKLKNQNLQGKGLEICIYNKNAG